MPCADSTDLIGANTYEPDEGKGRGMFGNATMNFGNTVRKLKEEYMNYSKQ